MLTCTIVCTHGPALSVQCRPCLCSRFADLHGKSIRKEPVSEVGVVAFFCPPSIPPQVHAHLLTNGSAAQQAPGFVLAQLSKGNDKD